VVQIADSNLNKREGREKKGLVRKLALRLKGKKRIREAVKGGEMTALAQGMVKAGVNHTKPEEGRANFSQKKVRCCYQRMKRE